MNASGQDMGRDSTQNVLSEAELQAYRDNGFLVPSFRFSRDEVARLKNLILRLVEDNPTSEDKVATLGTRADRIINCPHVPSVGGLRSGPGWMEFAAHPTVLDILEQVMGRDIILRGSVAFYKAAGDGPATPWHRDGAGAAVPIEPLASTAVWIAATDTYIENACLRFIPGSHREKRVGRHFIKDGRTTIGEEEYDESTAVDVEVEAGQMILFDIFTIHASRPNSGTRERASFAPRYMPATSRFNHDARRNTGTRGAGTVLASERPLILVRGVDLAGNDFRRGHPA